MVENPLKRLDRRTTFFAFLFKELNIGGWEQYSNKWLRLFEQVRDYAEDDEW